MKKKAFKLFFVLTVVFSFAVSLSCINAFAVSNPFSGGEGTADNPYIIETVDQLEAIQFYRSCCFILNNDLTFSDSLFEEGGEFYNGGKGWTPIGKTFDDPFTGNFDGNGKTIKGLKTWSDLEAIGLFGYVSGTVKNLKLSEVVISGANTSDTGQCGAIIGYLTGGRLINCNVLSGSIQTTCQWGISGGLVGILNHEGSIICSNNSANVISNNYYAGGIAGSCGGNGGTIRECYNDGIIDGGEAGGIVGSMGGLSLCNCYNSGSVHGSETAGGMNGGAANYNHINNFYNIGSISGEKNVGSLCGNHFSGEYANCYSNANYNIGSLSMDGELIQQEFFSQPESFKGFDFDSIWIMSNNGPLLRSSGQDILEHKLVLHPAVEPTCTEKGNNEYYICDYCGAAFKSDKNTITTEIEEVIPPKGHQLEKHEEVAPTCTTDGNYEYYTCANCDIVYKADGITETLPKFEVWKATGHIWESDYTVDVEATFEEEGRESIHCSVCDTIQEESIRIIPKKNHIVDRGTCGENLTWTLDDVGLLTISGEGGMSSWASSTVPWKDYKDKIKNVIIESEVTSIGNFAFYGCSSLTSITIPESVTSIENDAFYNCSSLTSITIPESVTSIGDAAFYGCNSLVSIYVIKDSYADTWLKDNGYSEKIKYVYKSGEHYYFETVTEPTCEETGSKHLLCVVCGETTDERIPALGHNIIKVEAKEPTLREDGNIEYWLCERCGKCFSDAEGTNEIPAESVVIPKTGGEIIESGTCGANGDNLTWTLDENGVLIISGTGEMYSSPNDLHTLPWYRKDIKHVVIEDGVTSIGGAAFIHSATLVDISIPASVTKIGNMAFAGCSSMTSIVIPEGVTGIGINEFQDCSSLNSVVIPASVTSIGDGAFAGCSSLASLSIPETVKSIGANAFAGCNSLTSIVIPEGVTAIASSTFSNCTNLESIEIPEGVTEVGWSAFKNCSNLTEISLPSTLLTLDGNYVGIYEGGAFYGCINLKNIIIPESVTSIGDRTFYGCSSLESIIIPSSVGSIGTEAFNECTALESVIIEDGLVSIGFDVFENCQNLTKILIPESVKSIGERPFTNCDRLTDTFVIKDSYADTWLNNNEYSETIKYVYKSGEHYYYETVTEPTCEENGSKHIICVVCNEALDEQIPALGHNLAKVEAKESTLREDGNIEYWLCERCGKCFSDAEGDNEISAESVVIPKTGGEIIDSGTCGADGDNLTWTLDENGVLVISGTGEMYSPFNEMPRLPWYGKDIKHVIIEEGVTTIGNDAFQRCSSLTSIEIPESVTAIRNGAFYGCSSLTNIEIPESVTSIGDSTFFRCNSLTSITIPDGVTSIGGHTFYGCSSLTSIIIPDSVMSIGQGAFSECSNLTSIDIPEGVTSMEYASFEGCINLTSVTIPKSVTNIGERAFYGCSSLESINIPEGVTNIGEDAFNNCVSLKSLTIPESVSSIGEGVLNNCKSLISVYVVNDSYADTWLKDNGYSEKIKYVYKSGEHYYYETTVTEPTCEENGLKHILCVDSNEATDEQIPATGHTPGDIVRENEVFATCIEAGSYDEVVYCQTCNKELSRNKKVVPALGHDMIHHGAKVPTCEEIGWDAYDTCSRCDYTTYVEIHATGHTPVTDPEVAPTCEGTGLTEGSHCSVCGKVIVEQETIVALGHDWGEWVVVKEATTTEEGLERRTCLRDESHYEDRVIPKKIPEKTGWINEDGYWYFYEQDGTMAVSIWKKDSKGWCYLAEDGRMVTNGWAKDTKGWCWIGPAGYMIEKTQWVKYDGGWYHITNGYRDQSKWMKDSQGWCWLQEDGRMLTNGWAKDSKGWCWIAANGYMPTTTQWIKYDDGWYHITKGYRDESKWMKDSKGWCWLQADGRMLTNGWAKDSKGWCWIGDSGYMVTDTKWIDVDGVRYYIKKGYMAVNCWAKDDNGWLYLGPDGLPVTGTWKKDTKGWCYVGDDGYMVTNDFVKDTKGWCWIGEAGYMIEEDMWIGEAGAEGSSYIIKGYRVDDQTIEIDGVEYTFDQDGKLVG